MRMTVLLMCALLSLSACGEPEGNDPNPNPNPDPDTPVREAGFGPSDKAILWVPVTDVAQEQCSNQAEWAAGITAFAADLSNGYVAYGGNAEGTLDLLSCRTPGLLSTCETRNPRVLFAVNGLEYTQTSEAIQGVDHLECNVVTRLDAVLTDGGSTITERITRTHRLEGVDCGFFEETVMQESPNGFGISACTVTYTSQMEVRDWSPR